MLLGVIPAPGAEAKVRRTARMAARIGAELEVVNVARPDEGRGGGDGLDRSLYADNLAIALVGYAQSEQVSHIVVGSSQRSRWHEALGGGSIVGRVSRLAGEAGIDVHIMALPEADR